MSVLQLIRPRYVSDGTGPAAPGAPALSGVVSTTGFTITWPPASDISGVEGYRIYIAQDPAAPARISAANFDTIACRWIFTGLSPNTAYRVQVEPIDVFGNVGSRSSITTISTAAASSASALLAGTEFTGVDANDVFIQSYGGPGEYTAGVERRMNGTDTATGTVWSDTSPLILEATAVPRWQILARSNDGSRAYVAPETLFTATKVNRGGSIGWVQRIVRNQNYIVPDQYAFRHFPLAPRARQGIICIETVFALDPTWDLNPTQGGVISEVKFNGIEEKIELGWWSEIGIGGGCGVYLATVRGNQGNPATWGATNLWGNHNGGSPVLTRTVTPTPSSVWIPADGSFSKVFSRGIGAFDPAGAAPVPGSFVRAYLAFLWGDPAGNSAGNAGSPWVACWTAIGTPTSLPVRGTEQLRFLVQGSNIHSSIGNGADIIFSATHYADGGTGKNLDIKAHYVYEGLPHGLSLPSAGEPNIAALPLGEYDVGDWNGFLANMVNVNDSWVDKTGVTMRVLTSPAAPYPAGDSRSYTMNYGAGGSRISQSFGPAGNDYWIVYMAMTPDENATPRLARFRRGVGVVSDVELNAPGLNMNRLSYTFSYRAGETDILYYTDSLRQIRRFNVATGQNTRAGFTGHSSLFNGAGASTAPFGGTGEPGWLTMTWDGSRFAWITPYIAATAAHYLNLDTGVYTTKDAPPGLTLDALPLRGAANICSVLFDNDEKAFWFVDTNRFSGAAAIPGTQGHSDTGENHFYTTSSDGSHVEWHRTTPGTSPAVDRGPWNGQSVTFVPGFAPNNVVMDGDYHPSMGWNQLGKGGSEQFLVDSDYANPYRHAIGTWTVHAGAIYRASVTWGIYGSNAIGPAGVLLWNGINGQNVGAFTGHLAKAPSLAGMTPGTWWWQSNLLYVWMPDGGSPLNRVQVISGSLLFSSVGFFRNSDGQVRRLCFTYRNDATYSYHRMTYVNQSQDGRIAVFGSNRGIQGGRNYLNVVELPLL